MNSSEERQLHLSNMSVCNITEPANYFHALRRQVLRPTYRKPLIVMSPKKLLRLKEAKSDLADFTNVAGFRSVLPDTSKTLNGPHTCLLHSSSLGSIGIIPIRGGLNPPQQIKQLIFCSGQIYYDLIERRAEKNLKDVAIVRLEQIAPFPYQRVKDELARYPGAEVCWTQEEHRNQGAWSYVKERLDVLFENTKRQGQTRYIGRKVSGSTAVGSLNTHKQQHAELLDEAFRR